MKNSLILAVVISLVLAATANAAFKEGDREWSIFGNYIGFNFDNDGSEDALGAGVAMGHFVSDELQVGLQALGSWSGDVDLYAAGLNLKHHFMAENAHAVYIGGQLNYAYAENTHDDDGLMWGPLAGVRCEMDNNTCCFVEYQYQLYNGDIGDTIDDAHALLVGFAFKF